MTADQIISKELPDTIQCAAVEHWNKGECELHDRMKAEFQQAQLDAINRFVRELERRTGTHELLNTYQFWTLIRDTINKLNEQAKR
jgi:hypothetical protein